MLIVTTPTDPSPAPIHLHEHLLPCFRCGYDLRGSAPNGECPECGQPYRRELHYPDVVHQKLREVIYNVEFVYAAGVTLAVCVLLVRVTFRLIDWDGFIWPAIQIGLVLGFFYLLLVTIYLNSWFNLWAEICWHKTLHWAQVRGVGLSKALGKAGVALMATPALLAFV